MGVSENWGTLFWGPYNKDPTTLGYYVRVPYFGKLPYSEPRKVGTGVKHD